MKVNKKVNICISLCDLAFILILCTIGNQTDEELKPIRTSLQKQQGSNFAISLSKDYLSWARGENSEIKKKIEPDSIPKAVIDELQDSLGYAKTNRVALSILDSVRYGQMWDLTYFLSKNNITSE